MDALVDELDIHAGETTQDFKFSLESIACFGSCALAPVMVVDKNIYGRMTTAKARQILGEYKGVK
jgi:NADH:ubiquinone oxidoreductase subunit E